MTSLLPPNITKLERALEQALTPYAPPRTVPTLWNPQTCPANMLPWLAWACSVEDWDHQWSAEQKRAAIAATFDVHRYKGTAYAIKKALEVRGHPDAILVERADCIKHNGVATRNGYYRRGGPTQWATYRVILQRPITLDQAASITALLWPAPSRLPPARAVCSAPRGATVCASTRTFIAATPFRRITTA